ncbi:cupin-like domain-containing protein [Ekhidna sp.]|uniref:cupin-like domain-containing protein n=1 Tax=Ekhidna sp. TaxID=2608089 RepID=UPI0032EFD8E9
MKKKVLSKFNEIMMNKDVFDHRIISEQVFSKTTIAVEQHLGRDRLYKEFVEKQRPVLIKGMMKDWPAVDKWNLEFFSNLSSDHKLPVKVGDVSKGEKKTMTLAEYSDCLIEFTKSNSPELPPYLHDVPIFLLIPELRSDITSFPVEYLSRWYRNRWWEFVQFFMGSKGSLTPLHFDTLVTHNLFFQVTGSKLFYLIDSRYKNQCYMNSWRWSDVDVQHPDFEKFPSFANVKVEKALVESGDILYIPPGTLHQVHGLSNSVSFNIDWHTKKSVWTGLLSGFRGAPSQNVYYNYIVALGLFLGIPSNKLFSFYQSYLNYVS